MAATPPVSDLRVNPKPKVREMSLATLSKPRQGRPIASTVIVSYLRNGRLETAVCAVINLRWWLGELRDSDASILTLTYRLPDGSYFEVEPLTWDSEGLPLHGLVRRCWSPNPDWLASISALVREQEQVKVIIPF